MVELHPFKNSSNFQREKDDFCQFLLQFEKWSSHAIPFPQEGLSFSDKPFRKLLVGKRYFRLHKKWPQLDFSQFS